jgi:hypothetical protein
MTTNRSKYRGTKQYHLVFCKLINAAQQRHEVTYKEVATILGIHIPGNYMGRAIGQVLGEISEDEHAAGRPMLSAIVRRDNGIPGKGFFTLARELGKLSATDTQGEIQFWQDELEKVFETWRA